MNYNFYKLWLLLTFAELPPVGLMSCFASAHCSIAESTAYHFSPIESYGTKHSAYHQHCAKLHNAKRHYADCRYAEWWYGHCHAESRRTTLLSITIKMQPSVLLQLMLSVDAECCK
jgi:hypothetical protein